MHLSYHLRIYRAEHLWLPAGLWGLFAVLVAMMRGDGRAAQAAASYLGYVVPLTGGVLAASAVVEDPALELQFAAPRAPWRLLLERLALLLALVALAAVTFQAYLVPLGVGLEPLGGVAGRQLVWLTPTLALMALGSLGALAFVQGTGGALLAGLMWILHLTLRGWFMSSRWARYLFLFLGELWPDSPALPLNRLALLGVTMALTLVCALLLKREERYL